MSELSQIKKQLNNIESMLRDLMMPGPEVDMYVTALEFRKLYPMSHSRLEDLVKRKKLIERKRPADNPTGHWLYNLTAYQRYLKQIGQKIAA